MTTPAVILMNNEIQPASVPFTDCCKNPF